jgi:hypothetical protein
VPDPSAFEVEVAIDQVKSHKSAGIDQIPAEMIKTGGIKVHSEIHTLISSVWNKELSVVLPTTCSITNNCIDVVL